MNPSFRSADLKIQSSLRQRRGLELGNVTKEKEEELALFLDMQKREKERSGLLLGNGSEFGPSSGSKPGISFSSEIAPSTSVRRFGPDDFLNTDGEKNDYDWLLTPPGTPIPSSLEKELHGSLTGLTGTPNVKTTELKCRLSVPQINSAPRSNPLSRQAISSLSLTKSTGGLRQPTSSISTSSTASRPSTPTGRSNLPAATKPIRASTPTSRPTLPFVKSVPTSAKPHTSSARSSTPTSRTALPSKSLSRPSTPTRSLAVPNNPGPPARPTSVPKSRSTTSKVSMPATSRKPVPETTKTPLPSRGNSPTVRSRPWQPSQMPGFSLDAPPNLKTSLPERPVSASRGIPAAPSSLKSGAVEANSNGRPRPVSASRGRPAVPSSLKSGAVEANSNIRPRRQSCSPMGLRGRAPISGNPGSREPSSSRLHSNGSESGDTFSPVVMGNKMVERVINMRRLAPPRQDEQLSSHDNSLIKPSQDSTGFGRTLSKKSLDMALRHMDIRRSIPKCSKPMTTSVSASSFNSARSVPVRTRPASISDSPVATSSNASSEQSVNNFCLDVSEKDDVGSDRGCWSSPADQPGNAHKSGCNDREDWLHYPEIRENHC